MGFKKRRSYATTPSGARIIATAILYLPQNESVARLTAIAIFIGEKKVLHA
jgi:hypothetical protein